MDENRTTANVENPELNNMSDKDSKTLASINSRLGDICETVNTIKNCVIFFTALAAVGLLCGAGLALSQLFR